VGGTRRATHPRVIDKFAPRTHTPGSDKFPPDTHPPSSDKFPGPLALTDGFA